MTALDDRRQRALEAGEDADDYSSYTFRSIEVAIETATRVQITPEIIAATGLSGVTNDIVAGAIIKAAFEAAGFEVEP